MQAPPSAPQPSRGARPAWSSSPEDARLDEGDAPDLVVVNDEPNRKGKPSHESPTRSLVESVPRIREGRGSDALEDVVDRTQKLVAETSALIVVPGGGSQHPRPVLATCSVRRTIIDETEPKGALHPRVPG